MGNERNTDLQRCPPVVEDAIPSEPYYDQMPVVNDVIPATPSYDQTPFVKDVSPAMPSTPSDDLTQTSMPNLLSSRPVRWAIPVKSLPATSRAENFNYGITRPEGFPQVEATVHTPQNQVGATIHTPRTQVGATMHTPQTQVGATIYTPRAQI